MAFKLTYATMFDPPEELHARFDEAMRRLRGRLGEYHALYIAGADRRSPFGGWKGSGTTGKAIASFYYLPQYLREQSQTVVE
jgi:hypothetical protein